jgi:hypothetical protein
MKNNLSTNIQTSNGFYIPGESASIPVSFDSDISATFYEFVTGRQIPDDEFTNWELVHNLKYGKDVQKEKDLVSFIPETFFSRYNRKKDV